MKALVEHNSDEVITVFIGETDEEILAKVKAREHWDWLKEDIEEYWDKYDDGGNEIPFSEDKITMEDLTDIHHDGDSSNGYTLLEAI